MKTDLPLRNLQVTNGGTSYWKVYSEGWVNLTVKAATGAVRERGDFRCSDLFVLCKEVLHEEGETCKSHQCGLPVYKAPKSIWVMKMNTTDLCAKHTKPHYP